MTKIFPITDSDYESGLRIRIFNQNSFVHDGLKTIFHATFCRIIELAINSISDPIFYTVNTGINGIKVSGFGLLRYTKGPSFFYRYTFVFILWSCNDSLTAKNDNFSLFRFAYILKTEF